MALMSTVTLMKTEPPDASSRLAPRCKFYPRCPYIHRYGPRDHEYCCNACFKEELYHTDTCTGRGRRTIHGSIVEDTDKPDSSIQKLSLDHSTMYGPNPKGFFLPRSWIRGEESAMRYVDWYLKRYDLSFEIGAAHAWHVFSCQLYHANAATNRPIRLYAWAHDRIPNSFNSRKVDITLTNLNARSNRYEMSKVTGVDLRVQAVLVTQKLSAEIILSAVQDIEQNEHDEFAFVCHGATHRSVACCILLAAIVYPNAQVCFTTDRTQRAAHEYKW